MNANWNYPTNIRVGAGRIKELRAICAQLGISRPLLVTVPGLAALPMVDAVIQHCRAKGLGIACFSQIKPNPTGDNINDGALAYIAGNHDGVIAMGGGSGLDAGKAIALIARQSCSLWELAESGGNAHHADASLIPPVIAVPTTAGTSSEVGRASLIVNESDRRKVIVVHAAIMPRSVILDPELTIGLPAGLTAATGMDALSHNLEAYCSPVFHPMAEGISMQGIRLVQQFLPRAVSIGKDLDARLQMLVASTMGATAFQRGLGAMHALAHPLGAVYDAHHGMLNAILMPYVLKANYPAIKDCIGRLATFIDVGPDFDAFMNWLLATRESIGIPKTLTSIIEPDDQFGEIGEMAVKDPTSGTNPIKFDAATYQRIATAALNGDL